MSQYDRFVGGKGVSLRQRTIIRKLTFPAVTVETPAHTTITVPASNITRAQVYLPPGTNYSLFLQLGFNGQVQIPSDDPDDYIIGPGIAHTFEWGIDALAPIDVWSLRNNAFPHTVYVRLDCNLQAMIDYAQPKSNLRLL